MTPLILGASGQVGQALILECEKRGWRWQGSCHEHPIDPRLFKVDLADLEGVRAAVTRAKADVVFMPSGWTWVDGCEDDPQRARTVNALAPEAVAQLCARTGAGLVFYSTDYVFGEKGGPYDELAPTGPLGVYGASKLEGEQRVLAACPEALILRTNVVFGPEPQGKNFVYQLVRALAAGKPLTLPSDQLSSPTYNRDLARASVELVEGLERGVWNVAGPEVVDRATFGRLAAAVFGLDAGLIRAADTASLKQKARRPLSAGLRIEKLVERLGWKPLGPLEALNATKAAMEKNGQLAALKASV
jgi:dTDP-4-dehydrorhamnose reductase